MRFLRNLLLFIILAYGLVYGYLWYETNTSLQRLTEGAAPFAKIEYASFFVSPLANEITVDNISIVPQMAADEFRIDQVRLYADMPGFFLLSGKAMQEGTLPENMDIGLSNIQVNLDGKFISMLEQMSVQAEAQPEQVASPFLNLDALGCGEIEKFQLVDYRLMGIKRVNADINLHLSFNKITDILGVQIDAKTRGVYDISLATDIKIPSGKMDGVTQTNKIPPMRLSINDTGFYKMRNAYCATANKSSDEEYVDHHMQLLSSTFGVTLPESITTAYRDYMLKGGRINLSIKPQDNLAPEELGYYKPLEVVDMLGLKLSIGNTRIDLEELLNANAPAVVAKKPDESNAVSTKKSSAKETSAKPAAVPALVNKNEEVAPAAKSFIYHVEKVENAEKHIDKPVEITLRGNKVRRGTLEKVKNDRLYLIIELQGGSVTYPIRTNEISKFRVKY